MKKVNYIGSIRSPWFTAREFIKELIFATVGAVIGVGIEALRKGQPLIYFYWSAGDSHGNLYIRAFHLLIAVIVILLVLRYLYYKFGRGGMVAKRRMYKNMKKLVEGDEYLLDVQLYQSNSIIPSKSSKGDSINLHVKRVGGYTKKSCDINCILSDGFNIPRAFYDTYFELVNETKEMKKRIDAVNSSENDREFFFDLARLTLEISDVLDIIENTYFSKIKKIKNVETEHLFIYRFMFSLAEIMVGYLQNLDSMMQHEVINYDDIYTDEEFQIIDDIIDLITYYKTFNETDMKVTSILNNAEVESYIKRKRTSYLGALIYDDMWCYSNTDSLVKAGRCYFAVPYNPGRAISVLHPHLVYFMIVSYNAPANQFRFDNYAKCQELSNKILEVIR